MNKKIFTVLAAAAVLATITSCGTNNSSSSKTTDGKTAYKTKVNETWSLPTLTNIYNSAYTSMQRSISVTVKDYTPNTSKNVTLNMSVNYNKSTGMKYTGEKTYTTPSGTEITNGSFKPTYRALQERLNFTINDVTDTSASNAVTAFKTDGFGKTSVADIACANVSDVVDKSVSGDNEIILDLSQYLDKMPNFSKMLKENPAVLKSIVTCKHSNPSANAIYYLPYFDGYEDVEKYTLLRSDYVTKLLDGDFNEADWDTSSDIWTGSKYEPTCDTGDYSVTVPADTTTNATKVITKSTTADKAKNIIAQQNALPTEQRTAAVMVKQFRDYIDARYGSQYTNRSDLFLGVDASYDADEMIALMRIARVSPKALTGDADAEIVPFVTREYNNQRIADLYRWAGQLWGVRGMESRCGYLYIGTDGKVHDARGDDDLVDLLSNLNAIYDEGLILKDFENKSGYGVTNGKYAETLMTGYKTSKKYSGFMMYDYSQSQGALNDKTDSKAVTGYCLTPIIGAVANWDDGDDTTGYFHFTESWRSVKTQGWCLNADLAKAGNEDKLARALAVVDYLYSDKGHELNSYGPSEYGYTNGTIDYLGKTIAKFSDEAIAQFNDKDIGAGNYTNYLRIYVGASLPIGYIKEQGMEYQLTSENARKGVDIVNHAIEVGTYKHLECGDVKNTFYAISPSSYKLSSTQVTTKTQLEDKNKLGSINSSSSTDSFNIWDQIVMNGWDSQISK